MTTGESLTGSDRVRKLQTILPAQAKEAPDRRCHALIDKVWREDFLAEAWRRVRRNGGSAGVDGKPSRTLSHSAQDSGSAGSTRWKAGSTCTTRTPGCGNTTA